MRPDSIIILVLVFAIVTIAVGGIIGDMNNNYEVNASVEFQNQYNFQSEISSNLTQIVSDSQAVGKESGWLQILSGASAIWQGTKTTVLLILGLPFYLTSMIRGVASNMGLPPVVSDLIIPIFITMIIVVLVFITIRFIRGENV